MIDSTQTPFNSSKTDKHRLIELLFKTRSIQYSSEKPFTLASGILSPYYFDLKSLCGHYEGINLVARMFYDQIKKFADVKSVGGLEFGSISIATAISQLSYFENKKDPLSNPLLTSFFVRKTHHKYGTQKLIEGEINSSAVIINDVITSGMSALFAMECVKATGSKCLSMMSIIFRGMAEQRLTLEKEGNLQFIFYEDQIFKEFEKYSKKLSLSNSLKNKKQTNVDTACDVILK